MRSTLIDERVIAAAFDAAKTLAGQSQCQKMHFGAILLSPSGTWLGQGFNHSKVPHLCCMREGVPSGTQLEKCGAVHAEQAALLSALGHYDYEDVTGGSMVVVGSFPDGRMWQGGAFYCTFCARLMAEAGLDWVIVPNPANHVGYRRIAMADVLDEAYSVALGKVAAN